MSENKLKIKIISGDEIIEEERVMKTMVRGDKK